jgi:hypothetical protein
VEEQRRGGASGGAVEEGAQACHRRPWGWGSEDRAREGSAAADGGACVAAVGRRRHVGGPKGGYAQRVGATTVRNKNIMFLAETFPKLQFLWSFHLFGHQAT